MASAYVIWGLVALCQMERTAFRFLRMMSLLLSRALIVRVEAAGDMGLVLQRCGRPFASMQRSDGRRRASTCDARERVLAAAALASLSLSRILLLQCFWWRQMLLLFL
jgi:hypothetical protein